MGFLTIFMTSSILDGGMGLSITVAGYVLSLGQLSNALLQQPCGRLADSYNKNMLIVLGGVISALGMVLFPFSKFLWHIMGARLMFSLGSALMIPALGAIAAIEGREYGVGTTMSVLQSAMSLGMMGGPLLAGILADMFNLTLIFYIGSAISFIGLVTFIILTPKK
jgi:MFS family permease